MTEPVTIHCRDVRNRPQRITVSTADGWVQLTAVPAGTARLDSREATWLAEALLAAAGPAPDAPVRSPRRS